MKGSCCGMRVTGSRVISCLSPIDGRTVVHFRFSVAHFAAMRIFVFVFGPCLVSLSLRERVPPAPQVGQMPPLPVSWPPCLRNARGPHAATVAARVLGVQDRQNVHARKGYGPRPHIGSQQGCAGQTQDGVLDASVCCGPARIVSGPSSHRLRARRGGKGVVVTTGTAWRTRFGPCWLES